MPMLPSQYEDLSPEFRGRLRADPVLLKLVQDAHRSMKISGGVRFLPLYGRSGSGKSSAARELSSHLEGVKVIELSREAVASRDVLFEVIKDAWGETRHPELLIAIVDQYEETVSESAAIPKEFVERISLGDRNELRGYPIIFLWLTTSKDFQRSLAGATTRNARILIDPDYELVGPDRTTWSQIIEETFEFHNDGKPLADEGVLQTDIDEIGEASATIGETMLKVGRELGSAVPGLHDLSKYQIVMLWPVADGKSIGRIQAFTHPRDGYTLNWNAFWRDLNSDDRRQLPLGAYNRARLHFDVRLVPIAVADLHQVSSSLNAEEPVIGGSYVARFALTHFVSLLKDNWDADNYSPMRERESKRSREARTWYQGVTTSPVALGRRIAYVLRQLGLDARHEVDIPSGHSTVRADVLVNRPGMEQSKVIVELKAYSSENTMPSTVRDQIKTTLRRHATFAGFMPRT